MDKDETILMAEFQALKLLVLTMAASQDNADEIVASYLLKIEELQGHALYEPILSDSFREQVGQFAKLYSDLVVKWHHRQSDKAPD